MTETGVRYARGIHVVSRRPELRIISVNQHGEIVDEYTQPMTKPGDDASPRVVALIETSQALIQQQQLHEQEPWFDTVPLFIPPYESPDAGRTAICYMLELRRQAENGPDGASKRGVHCHASKADDHSLILSAVTSTGDRIAEDTFDLLSDPSERLLQLWDELKECLDQLDPTE